MTEDKTQEELAEMDDRELDEELFNSDGEFTLPND